MSGVTIRSPQIEGGDRPSFGRRFGPGIALVGLIALVYLRSLGGQFIWDDETHVAANPTIVGPLGLKEIWTTAAANYFPLVLTNFWVQHALWGLNAVGYHAVTVVCHMAAALLLWRVLVQLEVPGAWLGAALWALHPVQVESVAWISELKNTQSAVFFLLAIWFWLKWVGTSLDDAHGRLCEARPARAPSSSAPTRAKTIVYWLALLCAVLALLSKPSTVMLPVVLALISWWRGGGLRRRVWLRLAPFFLVSAVTSGWAIWEQKFHSGAMGAEWSQTWPQRCVIAGRVAWFYLGKLFWPRGLSFIYPRWEIHADAVLEWLPFVLLLVAGGWLWVRRNTAWRPAFVVAIYFIAMLVPVLGFFDVYFFRYSYVGDHFQYLASMGPLALVAAGVARIPRRIGFAAGGLTTFGLAVLSWNQSAMYHDNLSLWEATLERSPNAVMAWLNYGDVLSWAKRYPESIAAYRRAIALRPEDPDGHRDLGKVLALAGDPAAAVPELERALALKPDAPLVHNDLGNAFRALNRDDEALKQYAEAVRLKPDYAGAHNNLAVELMEAGRLEEAIPHYETALRLRPEAVKARDALLRALQARGEQLMAAGQWSEAVANARKAVEWAPDLAAVHEGLAFALLKADQPAAAITELQKASNCDPASPDIHEHLAELLRSLGRNREALEQFELAGNLRRQAPTVK